LDQLVADVTASNSRVLVLRGEAGVGKTALIDHLASAADGCRVLRATGVESEMELAFAGLHQLCSPMLRRIDHLPAPQRDALGTAFGQIAGQAADRFLVGLAVLSLLGDVAESKPLLCIVDDAQWLDQVSAQILAFVARRLLAEPVGLVFAVREPTDAFAGLPHLSIPGLGAADARALLESVSPGRLDEPVRDRIVAEARGNPLALLELPRGLTAAELAGGFARPDARPLMTQMERSFVRRVQSLPAPTQQLLVLAAAEPTGDAALLGRASRQLGVGSAAQAPAEAEGLIEFGTPVRFRHPLVRSAAYRSATPAARREAHRALAEATDPEVDPDRRVWHLAQAAAEPDEEVAAGLERSADRARRRGGAAAAAAFLTRAAELTADPSRLGARTLAAARAKFEAADADGAQALLTAAGTTQLDELQRAELGRLRAQVVYSRSRGSEAPPLLLQAANDLAPLDGPLARETYLEALGAAIFAGRLGTVPLPEVAAAASAALPDATGRLPTDLLLGAVARRFTDDHATSASPIRDTLGVLRAHIGEGHEDALHWLWLAWLLAGDAWDDDAWEEFATHAVASAREIGALGELPLALTYRASAHIHAGDFGQAAALLDESDSLTAAIGSPPLRAITLLFAAWRGDEPSTIDLLAGAMENAIARGEGRAHGNAGWVTAVLYNGLGRYAEALAGARRACEFDDLGLCGFALVELVEAAVHCGELDAAADALNRLERSTLASGTDWALGMLARSRALLASGDDADALYREAIERLARTRIVVHHARAHLVYGEWLRRHDRRRESRTHLRAAFDTFHSIGAAAFAERADRELRAAGETVRKRAATGREELTAQESQIARLAAQGRTNVEIGSELFISARTVEYHLSKVYPKLGITTRRGLRGALGRFDRTGSGPSAPTRR
jgi:DNA-binding CsgD family transcriptional regulator